MSEVIQIQNDGPLVLATNFFSLEVARRGRLYCSINAGAFRLLIPKRREPDVEEMRTAREVIISRGPWAAAMGEDALEFLFDDGSNSPCAVHLDQRSIDRLPARNWIGREFRLLVYTEGPTLALELPCFFRLSKKLPDLRPATIEKLNIFINHYGSIEKVAHEIGCTERSIRRWLEGKGILEIYAQKINYIYQKIFCRSG